MNRSFRESNFQQMEHATFSFGETIQVIGMLACAIAIIWLCAHTIRAIFKNKGK